MKSRNSLTKEWSNIGKGEPRVTPLILHFSFAETRTILTHNYVFLHNFTHKYKLKIGEHAWKLLHQALNEHKRDAYYHNQFMVYGEPLHRSSQLVGHNVMDLQSHLGDYNEIFMENQEIWGCDAHVCNISCYLNIHVRVHTRTYNANTFHSMWNLYIPKVLTEKYVKRIGGQCWPYTIEGTYIDTRDINVQTSCHYCNIYDIKDSINENVAKSW